MAKKKTNLEKCVETSKKTSKIFDPNDYKSTQPVWSFKFADFEHDCWKVEHEDFVSKSILKKLKDFEGMTWQEIDSASGGKTKGTNNHFISFKEMIKDAQNRARELKLLEYEELYSLRLGGRNRLYGILNNGIFYIVWYDYDHSICPSTKKNT